VDLGLTDTGPEAVGVQLELLRGASPARRLELALSLSDRVIGLAWEAIARRHPEQPPQEHDIHFVALHYGPDLAEEVRAYFTRRSC